MKTINFNEALGHNPSYHKTIRQSKILSKIKDHIINADFRNNEKRVKHLIQRKRNFQAQGWVEIT